MKNWLLAALMALVAVTTLPTDVEAKRLGGGGSAGYQRSMPARNDSAGTPAKQAPAAQPGQQTGATPAPAPKRNWMGPLAGLAAGLGIAALMSHFGMGEALGNFMMMALVAIAAVALVAFLMRRFGSKRNPAAAGPGWAHAGADAGAGNSGSAGGAQVAWPAAMQRNPVHEGSAAASFGQAGNAAGFNPVAAPAFEPLSAAPQVAHTPSLPADFDQAGFERIAKMIFIRMQAANDSGDLNDLRSFTTPEMFAHIRLELQERGTATQVTDVVDVAAEVLDLVRDSDRDIVSVRYHGKIREVVGGPVIPFDEIWHLVQPRDGSRNWAISGIQQSH